MNPDFDFELGAKVCIGRRVAGDEKGIIVGRAEYLDRPHCYHVTYVDGTGCYRSEWFNAPELTADDS